MSVYFKLLIIAFTFVLSGIQAVPTSLYTQFALKESVQPPSRWVQQGQAPGTTRITLRIGLTQARISELEAQLYAVSDPDSLQYGHFLSKAEANALLAPSAQGLQAVNEWLASLGFDIKSLKRSPSNDSVKVDTTISTAEVMLNTKYYVYTDQTTGESIVRTTSWGVPGALKDYIDYVGPTTHFSGKTRSGAVQPHSQSLQKRQNLPPLAVTHIPSPEPLPVDPLCSDFITPTCIFELYNATVYQVQEPKKSSIAVTGYDGQFANFADLQGFNRIVRPEASNISFKVFSIDGGQNSQNLSEAGFEADLDVQLAFSLAFPIESYFFTTAGDAPFIPESTELTDGNENFLDWSEFMLSLDKLPDTISTSYGDDEQTVPPSYARKVCNNFGVLGARGSSMIVAAGDNGVAGGAPGVNSTCQSNDGSNRTAFIPTFPPSCPFVTVVGGTTGIPEVAPNETSGFISSGGFSNYFSRPSYQDSTVLEYLNSLGDTYEGLFNRNGRAIPDVAAMGDNFLVVLGGSVFGDGSGTSAAAPTFAGMVALLNDARIAAKMSPLGFLNPFLYKRGFRALNDITIGSNPGCGTPGFNCTAGWDPVTGFGTPNFGFLKDMVLALPAGASH